MDQHEDLVGTSYPKPGENHTRIDMYPGTNQPVRNLMDRTTASSGPASPQGLLGGMRYMLTGKDN